jgi:hypothetical protein
VVEVMSVQPTSEKRTVLHDSGSAAWAAPAAAATISENVVAATIFLNDMRVASVCCGSGQLRRPASLILLALPARKLPPGTVDRSRTRRIAGKTPAGLGDEPDAQSLRNSSLAPIMSLRRLVAHPSGKGRGCAF